MRINEILQEDMLEDHIDLYYRRKTKEIQEILAYLHTHSQSIIGINDGLEQFCSLNDVYYFESIDKKTIAYVKNDSLKIDASLQELEQAYYEYGFIRVNKSTILNIYHIASLKTELNMRVIAQLDNGDKIQINRSYKAKFNAYLNKEVLSYEANQ